MKREYGPEIAVFELSIYSSISKFILLTHSSCCVITRLQLKVDQVFCFYFVNSRGIYIFSDSCFDRNISLAWLASIKLLLYLYHVYRRQIYIDRGWIHSLTLITCRFYTKRTTTLINLKLCITFIQSNKKAFNTHVILYIITWRIHLNLKC